MIDLDKFLEPNELEDKMLEEYVIPNFFTREHISKWFAKYTDKWELTDDEWNTFRNDIHGSKYYMLHAELSQIMKEVIQHYEWED